MIVCGIILVVGITALVLCYLGAMIDDIVKNNVGAYVLAIGWVLMLLNIVFGLGCLVYMVVGKALG